MKLDTKHFGEISIEEEEIITFDEGLPGFWDSTRFVLLADQPSDLFSWLQSVDDGDLVFALMDVTQVIPDYQPQIESELIEDLGDGTSFVYYNIAVVPEDLKDLRVNLKAPVLINTNARKGRQVLASNEDYSVRHYIFEEMSKQVAQC